MMVSFDLLQNRQHRIQFTAATTANEPKFRRRETIVIDAGSASPQSPSCAPPPSKRSRRNRAHMRSSSDFEATAEHAHTLLALQRQFGSPRVHTFLPTRSDSPTPPCMDSSASHLKCATATNNQQALSRYQDDPLTNRIKSRLRRASLSDVIDLTCSSSAAAASFAANSTANPNAKRQRQHHRSGSVPGLRDFVVLPDEESSFNADDQKFQQHIVHGQDQTSFENLTLETSDGEYETELAQVTSSPKAHKLKAIRSAMSSLGRLLQQDNPTASTEPLVDDLPPASAPLRVGGLRIDVTLPPMLEFSSPMVTCSPVHTKQSLESRDLALASTDDGIVVSRMRTMSLDSVWPLPSVMNTSNQDQITGGVDTFRMATRLVENQNDQKVGGWQSAPHATTAFATTTHNSSNSGASSASPMMSCSPLAPIGHMSSANLVKRVFSLDVQQDLDVTPIATPTCAVSPFAMDVLLSQLGQGVFEEDATVLDSDSFGDNTMNDEPFSPMCVVTRSAQT